MNEYQPTTEYLPAESSEVSWEEYAECSLLHDPLPRIGLVHSE